MNLPKKDMFEIRQLILEVYGGIPDPKRMLSNVVIYDEDDDDYYLIDYMIFTSHGPLAILLDCPSQTQLAITEALIKEFLYPFNSIKYIPAFAYSNSNKHPSTFFKTEEELVEKIVKRIFELAPATHEQDSYEYYSIAEQYIEENFETTMKNRQEQKTDVVNEFSDIFTQTKSND